MNYVYMIRCKDGSLYTGWTNNLEKRFRNHCKGKGAKYTRGRGPLELVYYEVFEEKKEAMKREYEIKQLKKSEKEKLINYKNDKNLTNSKKNIIDN
ncbi:MAG: GIY-YIG nuclease family protein [Clostridium sp.]